MDARPRGVLQRFPGAVDVKLIGPRQRGDDRPPDFRRDGLHRFKVALRGNGESRFQDVHAQAVELAGHLDFLRQVHAAAGRLLAVAQRGVKDENFFRHFTS